MRFVEIDVLKGLAVILMSIFHIYYFPTQLGYYEFNSNTTRLLITARIAQFIFIICVGINLVLQYKNSKEKNIDTTEYISKNVSRFTKLLLGAFFMSVFTYFVFGSNFVKFGILHFILLSTIFLMPFLNNLLIIKTLLAIVLIVWYLVKTNPSLFYNVPKIPAFLCGFYSEWGSVDHFSIIPWISLILVGILLGHSLYKHKPTFLSEEIKETTIVKSLAFVGKNSFSLYIIHWLVIYVVFCKIYPNYVRL